MCVCVCVVVVVDPPPQTHVFECLVHGSSTIRRCGLVGIGVALLKEVCDCGGGL